MYFRSLQILRGIAAIMVLLFHLQRVLPPGDGSTTTLFGLIPSEFSLGVSFFFALSGFLMAYLIDTGYNKFLLRRLLRIYPSFFLAVVLTLFFRLLLFGQAQTPGLYRAISLLPLSTAQDIISYPLGQIEWTLVYEVFFYFVCAIFANSLLRKSFLPFLLLWAALVIGANQFDFVASHLRLDETHNSLLLPSWKWIFLSPKNLLFMSGGLAYYAIKLTPTIGHGVMACTTLFSVGLFAYSIRIWAHGLPGTVTMSLSLLILIIGLAGYEKNSERNESPYLMVRLLEQLGDHSYGIYLVHLPVLHMFVEFTHPWYVEGHIDPTLHGLAALTFALMLGWYFGAIDLLLHGAFRRMVSAKISGACRVRLIDVLRQTEELGRPRDASNSTLR